MSYKLLLIKTSRVILNYYTVVHHRIHQHPLSANDFIIYVSRPRGSPPPTPLVYLAIFGCVSPTILSYCRADVRNRYSRYMKLVHKIGRTLLLATTVQPAPNLEYDPGYFRTFNPTLIEDTNTYTYNRQCILLLLRPYCSIPR